jgi:hypothetical protein
MPGEVAVPTFKQSLSKNRNNADTLQRAPRGPILTGVLTMPAGPEEKTMRKASLTAAGTLFLLLLAPLALVTAPALASIAPEVDLAWMTEKSVDIVAGEIVDQRCELREDIPGFKEAVITVFTIRVTHRYKGELAAEALTEFAILGGDFGGQSLRASDMPQGLAVGVSGIFFLRDWEGLRVPSAWEFGCAMHSDDAKRKVRTLGHEYEVETLEAEMKALLEPSE